MDGALLGPAPSPMIAGGTVATGWNALAAGRPREALSEGNRALEAIEPGTIDLGWTRLLLAWTAADFDDHDGAAREAGAAFEAFSAAADTEGIGRALMSIGWLAVHLDRTDEAGIALARALDHLDDAPDEVLRTAVLAVADLADAVGDPSSAQRLRDPKSPVRKLTALAHARCGVV